MTHLISALAEARRRLREEGGPVPLDRLTRDLAAFLSQGGGGQDQVALTALLDELEQLCAVIGDERNALAAELGRLALRGRASRAYAGSGG